MIPFALWLASAVFVTLIALLVVVFVIAIITDAVGRIGRALHRR